MTGETPNPLAELEAMVDAFGEPLRTRGRAALAHVAALVEAAPNSCERRYADGPCWCPDWNVEYWRDDDDPPFDERSHHEACEAMRAALVPFGRTEGAPVPPPRPARENRPPAYCNCVGSVEGGVVYHAEGCPRRDTSARENTND